MPKSNTRKGRLVIVTGIPGVGKTTVLTAALAACKARSKDVNLVNYGSIMFDEASKNGLVKTRDEMRGLPVQTQVQIQLTAAKAICKIADRGNVLLDTHMFINTPLGFMPGIPSWVGDSLKPDSIVLLEADPAEISKRRQNDAAIRAREADSPERISEHQMLGRAGAAALAVMTGCTIVIAHNREGAADLAASAIADLFM